MYKLNEEKMFFDIADGQAVVINFVTGMYYGTSTLGSAVLEALVKGAEPALIAEEIRKADGCPADFEEQLKIFTDTLVEKEIIIPAEGNGEPASIDAAAYSDGFELTVDEFAEVQDLLLADPVHDVNVEQGWPIMKEE
ncbi:MAG: hypothetical protein IKG70_01150 [Lachnospiraceae bacterium]|nr:hypothetical protein [Lachnospiraceae bacterium]